MEYKTKSSAGGGIILEKYTEPKGFFRNTTGSLKVGMIRLDDGTEEMLIHDFLFEDGYYDVYYMEFGCISGFGLTSYRGEAPRISIGDKKNNIPVEERIEFIYESLSSNTNYNCLAITHKDKRRGRKKLLFEIDKWHQETDIVTFSIDDL